MVEEAEGHQEATQRLLQAPGGGNADDIGSSRESSEAGDEILQVQGSNIDRPASGQSSTTLVPVLIVDEPSEGISNQVSHRRPQTEPANAQSEAKPTITTSSQTVSDTWQDVRFGKVELLAPWFPEVDPNHQTFRSRRSHRKSMLLSALGTSTTVLLANFVTLMVLETRFKAERGVVPLFEGSCTTVKRLDIFTHVCINILSTLLLGASNLCMQLLAAPTRKEVDRAHARRRWLDIGAPSYRNLWSIHPSRALVWGFLGLSSLPIHFVYNSVLSSSIPQYGYAAAVVSENFLDGAPFGHGYVDNSNGRLTPETWNGTYGPNPISWPPEQVWNMSEALIEWQNTATNSSVFTNLSNVDCLTQYTNVYGRRTGLLVVTEELQEDANASVHQYVYLPASFTPESQYWPCTFGDQNLKDSNVTCVPPQTENADRWYKFGRKVLYCLSEVPTSGDHCRLNYSPDILIAICVISVVKCTCIGLVAFRYRESTLCTIGDAIVSFLKEPDSTTEDMGFVEKADFSESDSAGWPTSATIASHSRKIPMYSGASARRWITTLSACAVAIVVATISVAGGAKGTYSRAHYKTFAWQLRQSLGTPDPDSFTGYFLPRYGMSGFVSAVIWANIWQVIVSFLYFVGNALFTCMHVAEEWNGYATERKTLRVSHPEGIQRSSYFISLPFKYGIPMMILITTLHWLISQSVFLVSTTALWPTDTEDVSSSFEVVGYSTSASFGAVLFGTSLVLIVGSISLLRLHPSSMPMVSTCSAAISAACHRPGEDVDAHLLPVKWGVISENEEAARCAFTTLRNVRVPSENEKVVGVPVSNRKARRVQFYNPVRNWRVLKRMFEAGFKSVKYRRV